MLVAAEEVELPDELAGLDTEEAAVVIETTGEVVGAAVIIPPLELVVREGEDEDDDEDEDEDEDRNAGESVVACAIDDEVVSDAVVIVAAILLLFGPYPGR